MSLKTTWGKIITWFTTYPVRFFLVATSFACLVLWYVNTYRDPDGFKWHDVIVESHGVLFDLLVFGILLTLYETLREKREKIERYQEEIDDYRQWNEKEAAYRILGIIRRLNKLGVTAINLSQCYISGLDLSGVDLTGANLNSANLHGSILKKAKLKGATLNAANLEGADLSEAILIDAKIRHGNLLGSNLTDANLQGADLTGAKLTLCQVREEYYMSPEEQLADWEATDFEWDFYYQDRDRESAAVFLGANLEKAILKNVQMNYVDFANANLKWADFSGSFLNGARLINANIFGTNFKNASMSRTHLEGSIVRDTWFESAKVNNVRGIDELTNSYEIEKTDTNHIIRQRK